MTLPTKNFSAYQGSLIEQPDLLAIQKDSYKWFIEKGLKELCEEISPIRDYADKELELYFGDYYFDEPKNSERKAKEHGLSYEAPLRVKVRLENKKGGEIKDQEIYLGDFPIMTKRGTFIVNGVERVIVSQIIRSSGVFFTAEMIKGRKAFGAKIIPSRGAWIEFETDADGAINVRIDRKRKMPVSTLFRIFGFKDNDEIMKAFADIDPDGTHMDATLKKDLSETAEDSYLEIYKRRERKAVDRRHVLLAYKIRSFRCRAIQVEHPSVWRTIREDAHPRYQGGRAVVE